MLVTYDVNTMDAVGKRRLSQVAKYCVKFGQRVQNSVFECLVNASQLKIMQNDLLGIIDIEKDSIRFYNLGVKYQTKILHLGAKETYDPGANLIVGAKWNRTL